MQKYNTDFTDEQINGVFNEYTEKAEGIYGDDKRMSKLAKTVKQLLINVSRLPLIGKYADDMLDLIDMVKDYKEGNYTVVPQRTINSILALLLYFASPIDLIPDVIPILGWLDDVAVIVFAYKMGIAKDLADYRDWKTGHLYADFNVIEDDECPEEQPLTEEEQIDKEQ